MRASKRALQTSRCRQQRITHFSGRGGRAHTLRAGAEKALRRKKKPLIVQDQYMTLITCYLLRCRETAGEEVHGRKVENSSQHNTCRLATRGRTLRAGQLYVCLGTNLGWSSPRSVFSWAHGAMSHSVLRTGGARCARVAAPNSGTTARVYDLKNAVAHSAVVLYCVARIGSGCSRVPPTCRLLIL